MGNFGVGISEVLLLIPIAFIVFAVLIVWRFVKALESIAKSFEKFVETKQHS